MTSNAIGIVKGPVFQMGIVVDDIDTAEQAFSARYGAQIWMRMPRMQFGPETTTYRGAPADYTIDSSLGYIGGQQIELITPVSGTNLYTEMIDRSGPGLQHIAWVPEDFDAAMARAEAMGIEVLQHCRVPDMGMEFAYLDGGPLGTCVELLRLPDNARAMFDSMIPAGFTNPWQR
ncbi:VOC family protein [Nocardia heshunensis]